ncbi:EAL domain-containing protein [Sinorhizobium sp. 8-89]|uniref:EAL domain-containing protein n=1 Tax=Sinorhizobium sp. 7-81 TaxID=3049087 RepID=UPI0024C263B5|nr:EAL domain-containing protein [Sinorhizobium sp. 7-81]
MNRQRVVIVAVALAVIGAIVPIAAMLYVSWNLAVRSEQDRLELFAERAITRANRSFAEARLVLFTIADSGVEPCSPDHIARMRLAVFDSRAVEEMGYFENRLLRCTSWGVTEGAVEQAGADYVTPDGIAVTIRIQPAVSGGKPMMALHHRNYNVLVDPLRFVDVILDEDITLAIVGANGTLVSALNAPDPALIKSIIAAPRTGIDENNLFAVARRDGWLAIATAPRTGMRKDLRRQQMMLLPVGAFIAAFIVGIVYWLSKKRLSPLGELTLAVQNREFIVHYQPIVALKTHICVGAEALVRWRRPDGSIVRPDLFIPLAEESGLILPITDQVIQAVVSDLGKLLVADRGLHIAINLSVSDLKTGRFLSVIENALDHTGIHNEQIWLEMTERGLMDIESARETITAARARGHMVAIDDFGTGYSSLQYLQGLPLDALKIDKTFIDTVGRDTATSSVTPHIIDMARTLSLVAVAEGVKTKEQADSLAALGVAFGQGWFFARPLPLEEFIAFYHQSKQQYGASPDVLPRMPAYGTVP